MTSTRVVNLVDQVMPKDRPYSISRLMKESGLGRQSLYDALAVLRPAGKCHVKCWRRTPGIPKPLFIAGPGKDAPKPPRQTGADYSRTHYKKHRQAPEKEQREARKLALANASLMAKTPQTPFSALFIGVRVPVMTAEG